MSAAMNTLSDALRRRPPPLAYAAVLLLGAVAAPLLLTIDDRMISNFASRRSLSNGSLYALKNEREYSYLQDLADVDPSIERRAEERAEGGDDDPDRCGRVMLYLSDTFADHGHGSQINTYVMAAATATYSDRAMVLLEAPVGVSKYAGGSQFGCPVDAFREMMTQTSSRLGGGGEASWEVREDFPLGFSRLVDHPDWLSRGCGVPCSHNHEYRQWMQFANAYSGGEFKELTCKNLDGSETNVVVAAGSRLRMHYREHEPTMPRFSGVDKEVATTWAKNLGATPREAEAFSEIKASTAVWDYFLALINKAGFLKLQPWIARDVELFLRTYDLPMDEEYIAIHVRRGDKLAVEARGEVIKYWRSQGHVDENNLPTDYVPFAHYLGQWDGPEVCRTNDGAGELVPVDHNVYVATDDPVVVRSEIAALPDHIDDDTILWNGCHRLRFYFNPTDDDAFHLNGDGEHGFEDGHDGDDSCFGRYHRNVASVADMMVLAKAKTFIGEYNSNWGRVIRTLRVRLNSPAAVSDGDDDSGKKALGLGGLTTLLDTRVAWGSTRERAPGY